MSTQTAPVETSTPKQTIKLGQFNGAFSRFQVTAFGDLKRMGCPELVAHKIAMDFGPDIGNAVLNSPDVAAKVAKCNKEGLSKIKISANGKTNLTNTMAVIRVIQQLSDMRQEGLIDSSEVFEHLNWTSSLKAYLVKAEKWAKDVEVEK